MSLVPCFRGDSREIYSAGGIGLWANFMFGGSKIGAPQSLLCGMHDNGLSQLRYLHIVTIAPHALDITLSVCALGMFQMKVCIAYQEEFSYSELI